MNTGLKITLRLYVEADTSHDLEQETTLAKGTLATFTWKIVGGRVGRTFIKQG